MDEVSLCLSCQDASNVMQSDPYLGHLSGQVICPDLRSNFQIDLSVNFRGQDLHVSMRLDERNTMVFRVFFLSFLA